MEVTLSMYLIVCPLVFLAAAIDAIGGGGGLISLPAYYLAGLSPTLAAGTNKFSACLGSFTASIRYLKSGKVLIYPALCAIAGALPGSYLGAEILKLTDESVIRMIMLVAVPLIALLIVFRKNTEAERKPITKRMLILCFLSGLAVGLYDGFFGPGAGTFYIMLFTWLCGMDMVTASGTAKPVNFASNIGAITSLLISGQVIFRLAIPAAACSVLGGLIGSRLAIRGGAKFIRVVMLIVMMLLMVKLAYDWLIA